MRFKQPRQPALAYPGAEAIAAAALEFLAEDPSRLGRFLGDSGMQPDEQASALAGGGTGVMAAALEHILADESQLLVFASGLRRKPEEVVAAHALLQGPAPQSDI